MQYMALVFPQRPEPLYTVFQEYAGAAPVPPARCPHSNFLKGVQWSPDGACLLTNSDDNWLRIFDLPQDALDVPAQAATAVDPPPDPSTPAVGSDEASAWGQQQEQPAGRAPCDSFPAALRVQEGETVYDMAWFPRMSTADPVSCCFATTSRAHPVHLWDACHGGLRCTYRGYNDVDEVTAAFSLCFSPDGQQLLAGYNKCMLVFDVTRPGREYTKIVTYVKRRQENLPGMVSCMAYGPPGSHLLAAGSYCGGIALYDTRTWEMTYLLQGHKGGLTQVRFTGDGNFLLSGARQDRHLICWDVRSGSTGELYRMERDAGSTNQRVQFDVEPCGRHLATGGCDGNVKVFDLQTGGCVDELPVALDTVNGCSFHPYLNLMAVATGHRRYPVRSIRLDEEDDDTETEGMSSDSGDDAQPGSSGRGRGAHTDEGCRQRNPDADQQGDTAIGSKARAAEGGAQARPQQMVEVQGGGVENTLRVFRLAYQMLETEAAQAGGEGADGEVGEAGAVEEEGAPLPGQPESELQDGGEQQEDGMDEAMDSGDG